MSKEIIVPTAPADQKKIFAAVKEAHDSLLRISAEKEQIKSIVSQLVEDFEGLNKKYINKLINTYYKQNIDKLAVENDDFQELYTAIVK